MEVKRKPNGTKIMGKKSTMVELVAELEAIEPMTPELMEMIQEAKTGEYHDYKNEKYICGKVVVVEKLEQAASKYPHLQKSKLLEIRNDVLRGVYDETADAEDLAELRKYFPGIK